MRVLLYLLLGQLVLMSRLLQLVLVELREQVHLF
jgi:hypothetical protein